jgi:hypothetical protein
MAYYGSSTYDLMQFRLDNTGGHISHLAGALFGCLCQIIAKRY